MRLALALVLLCACPGPPATYPSSISVRAYAAPEADRFVVFYHPWSADQRDGAVGRGGAEVLAQLAGLELSCENVVCRRSGDSYLAIEKKPPPEVEHVEVSVKRAGYEPARVKVPVKGNPYPVLLVLMKRARP